MNKILGIFLIGIIILIGAVIMNILASVLKIDTWFSFIDKIGNNQTNQVSLISYVFLFLIYPFILGLLGYFAYVFIFS